ncbi:MAG: helix-turn-helix domain-containing protein [Panacagrimonas sp.]
MKRTPTQTLLPETTLAPLRELGALLRSARTARRWPRAELAQRLLIAPATVQRMERGIPTVQIGIYAAAMELLGLGDAWARLIETAKAQVPTNTARRARKPADEVF